MSRYLMPCPLRSKQYCTVEQLARGLAEAGNNPRQAFRLASQHARGARLRRYRADRKRACVGNAVDDQVTVRDEVKRILNKTQDVMCELEDCVDRINGLAVELLLSGGLSEDAQALADNVGAEANELFNTLDKQVAALRKAIAAADDGDEADEAD